MVDLECEGLVAGVSMGVGRRWHDHDYVLRGSHSYVGLVRVVIVSFIFLSLPLQVWLGL